jgi:hypothetical protein
MKTTFILVTQRRHLNEQGLETSAHLIHDAKPVSAHVFTPAGSSLGSFHIASIHDANIASGTRRCQPFLGFFRDNFAPALSGCALLI